MKNLLKAGLILLMILSTAGLRAQTPETRGAELAGHPEFIALYQRLEQYAGVEKNLAEMNRIAGMETVSEEDRQALLAAMGFDTYEQALQFDRSNLSGLQKAVADLDLGGLSPVDLQHTLETGFAAVMEIEDDICVPQFQRCKTTAWAEYGINILNCTAIGAAFAGGTFWCAGCGGLLVGAACVTVAAVKVNNDIADCRDELVRCQDI